MPKSVYFLVALLAAAVTLALLLLSAPPPAGEVPAPSPAPAQAPEPPCLEEVCAERAARIVCDHRYGGNYCEGYRVEYERRCECLRRVGEESAPAPAPAPSPCAEDACDEWTRWERTDGPGAGVRVDHERRCSCFWPLADGGAL